MTNTDKDNSLLVVKLYSDISSSHIEYNSKP